MGFYTNVSRKGNNILYRGYNDHGKPIMKKVPFKPELFLVDRNSNDGWKTIDGRPLSRKKFDNLRAYTKFIGECSDIANMELHGDINPVYQFITKYFPKMPDFVFDQINIATYDIEVYSEEGFPKPEEAKYPITSIAYKSSKDNVYHVWGVKDYDTSIAKIPEGTKVVYHQCIDEAELIRSFIRHWSRNYPDIVTGWNIKTFDNPYVINRARKVVGESYVNKLSPWGTVNYREFKYFGKVQDTYDIVGVQTLDYKDVFIKFGYKYGKQETYALDHIAHTVLGKKKMSYDEYGSLTGLYQKNFQKYIDYNIRDVSLVVELEKETSLIELTLMVAYMGGVNYVDAYGTTGIWDSFIYRHLHQKKIAIPPRVEKDSRKFAGGYVKDPVPAKYDWVASFDLNSLYPNIIVQYNMSPETLIGMAEEHPSGVDYYFDHNNPLPPVALENDYSVAVNGSMYSKEKRGFVPEIIIDLYDMRRSFKGSMKEVDDKMQEGKTHDLEVEYNRFFNKQMAVKILLNSLYGALGNQYFRYFDLRIAEGVTLSGQMTIKWAERAINKYMNKLVGSVDKDYVIAIDTDSTYVTLKDLIDKYKPKDPLAFAVKVCDEKFLSVLKKAYHMMYERMNAFDSRMEMGREVVADKGFWTAKKRYVLHVLDDEGTRLSKPKMKVMGIEAVKSSTPKVCRDKFFEAFDIILNKEESDLQTFIENFYDEFKKLPAHDVASPRGVSDVEKWKDSCSIYKKGTPIHVRGSILFNKRLCDLNLDKKYEEIQNGSKIKYCYLKLPNPLRENVVAFQTFLPDELGLNDYVDHKKQFDKAFKEPLKLITNAVGWNVDRVDSIGGIFA